VKKEAAVLGVGVAGSELVGLVPKEALLAAADHYIAEEKVFVYQERQKIRLAVERLGLSAITQFIPDKRIIEYLVAEPPVAPLAALSVRGFVAAVADRTSAPGGGSVSALLAALGVGLGAMVAKLTYGVRKFEGVGPAMQQAIPILDTLTEELMPLIDRDTSAFAEYMAALKLPKASEEEQAARRSAMQVGLKTAVEVPLTTMREADRAWDALAVVARYGNPASASDIQVGARALEAGIWGAWQNVQINLRGIKDETYCRTTFAEAETLASRASTKCAEVLAIIGERNAG
jgi:glutamate formiminotransferase/formiminotetrahydrofolate cyclodeaminase